MAPPHCWMGATPSPPAAPPPAFVAASAVSPAAAVRCFSAATPRWGLDGGVGGRRGDVRDSLRRSRFVSARAARGGGGGGGGGRPQQARLGVAPSVARQWASPTARHDEGGGSGRNGEDEAAAVAANSETGDATAASAALNDYPDDLLDDDFSDDDEEEEFCFVDECTEHYKLPPPSITALVDAATDPAVSLQPQSKDHILLMDRPHLPPVAEVAAPELRLAGFRINGTTYAPSRADYFVGMALQRVDDVTRCRLPLSGLPPAAMMHAATAASRWNGGVAETDEEPDRWGGFGGAGGTAGGAGDADGQAPPRRARRRRASPAGSACAEFGYVRWSPDGDRFAFCVYTPRVGLELWCADVMSRHAWAVAPGARLNAVCGDPFTWASDSTTLLAKFVLDDRSPPVRPAVPRGPVVQEAVAGPPAPSRTYADVLKDRHDMALFEHYTTCQLARVSVERPGERVNLGLPAAIRRASPSPDGRYVLVDAMVPPYEYMLPAGRFPRRVEVWSLDTGAAVSTVAELPLQDRIPLAFDGVGQGPRAIGWRSDADATLYWAEAQDGGDPGVDVPIRDAVYTLEAPFVVDTKRRLASLAWRFNGLVWGDDGLALVTERRYKTRSARSYLLAPGPAVVPSYGPDGVAAAVPPLGSGAGPCCARACDLTQAEAPKRLILDVPNWEDRYNDPGSVVTTRNARGKIVLRVVYPQLAAVDAMRDEEWGQVALARGDLGDGSSLSLSPLSSNLSSSLSQLPTPPRSPTSWGSTSGSGDTLAGVDRSAMGRPFFLLQGAGASDAGDRPLLGLLDTVTGQRELLWRSSPPFHESVVTVLAEEAGSRMPSRLLVRREAPADAPNFFVFDLAAAMRRARAGERAAAMAAADLSREEGSGSPVDGRTAWQRYSADGVMRTPGFPLSRSVSEPFSSALSAASGRQSPKAGGPASSPLSTSSMTLAAAAEAASVAMPLTSLSVDGSVGSGGANADLLTAVTAFAHPAPQLLGVSHRLLHYTRADGVRLNGRLYLPPGYDAARDGPLPTLVWAYPREYSSASFAGQTRDSPHRFVRLARTPLYWLSLDYAVLDGPALPIIAQSAADEEAAAAAGGVAPAATGEANDTYVEQLVAGATAAVEAVVALGVADRSRVAIGGHSYGAFMTANLLAHAPSLFCCGIARSGAYNRTLTPFGFQAETRTLWQAPGVYAAMSPYLYAHRIEAPLLLIHGESDANPGTAVLQSERMYGALKGHGKAARLVLLPHEGHGYRARESVLHVLAEMTDWLERYCRRREGGDIRDEATTQGEPAVKVLGG
ncbi:hypothetical protein MMPV_000921 [Pyropia vietnamensis]